MGEMTDRLDALLARQPALAERYYSSAIVNAVVANGIVDRKTDEEILAIAVQALGQQADRLVEELIRSESTAVRTIDLRCEECSKTMRFTPPEAAPSSTAHPSRAR